MKKLISGAIVISMLAVGACAQSKKTTSRVMSENKSDNSKITYISMERTNCFGTCPHYIIEIYENGLVRYSGKTYADPKGVYETNINKAVISDIFKEFEAHKADTCSNKYEAWVSDLPALNYKIKYSNGKSKEIINAGFGPDYLKTLGKKIDEKIKPDDSWQKTADFNEKN